MNALIDLRTGAILCFSESADFGGPWGRMLRDGEAIFVPVPANEDPAHLRWNGQALVVDPAKKNADIAKQTAKAERRARIKGHSTSGANSIAALRAIVEDLLADKQDELGG